MMTKDRPWRQADARGAEGGGAEEGFAYGGQAVVEGVMMRGRRTMSVAVRDPSGEIVVWSEPLRPSRLAGVVRDLPLVRGMVLLADAMTLGLRALVFSSAVGAPTPSAAEARRRETLATAGRHGLGGTVALSVAITVFVFFLLPLGVAALLDPLVGSPFVLNLIEGLVRLGLLVAYVAAIGLLPDVRRVFGYHGAEHKAIHAWEAGAPLDVASVRRFPREHPRCGTGFMLMVMLLALVVFVALGPLDLVPRLGSRLLLVPLIAGVAYEVMQWGARRVGHLLARMALVPGMALQRLTTREPDDRMLETALAALRPVLAADGVLVNGWAQSATARVVGADARPVAAGGGRWAWRRQRIVGAKVNET